MSTFKERFRQRFGTGYVTLHVQVLNQTYIHNEAALCAFFRQELLALAEEVLQSKVSNEDEIRTWNGGMNYVAGLIRAKANELV